MNYYGITYLSIGTSSRSENKLLQNRSGVSIQINP